MSFQLVPHLVILNYLEGVIAPTLHYFKEFGSVWGRIT